MNRLSVIHIILSGLWLFCQCCKGVDSDPAISDPVNFNFHVKPILSDRCFVCHGPDKNQRKAELRLDMPEGLFEKKLTSGGTAFKPGNLKRSEAFQRITSTDPEWQMPPPESHLELTEDEINTIEKWIQQGATYQPHWAFIRPEKAALPAVQNNDWCQNPIDYFVLARLEKEGIVPQEKADKETLLRRITLDLTGLPPTMAEIEAFLNDDGPNAYEKVVDRLLDSEACGERLATEWLDVARYADTHGYTVDRYRDMSPWRDWVIKAFNDNQPFDEFVTWQLAGDLLAAPTREQLIATAFNRNHPQNAEGGIINEEFLVEYAANRVETFGTAFLGMTFNCSRCHDHKYDPIEQKEFYQLFSFFNNVDESGQITFSRYDASGPTMLLTDDEKQEQLEFIEQQKTELETKLQEVRQRARPDFDSWKGDVLQRVSARSSSSTWPAYPRGLVGFFPLEKVSHERIPNEVDAQSKGQIIDPVTNKVSVTPLKKGPGVRGEAVQMNGDDALAFRKLGKFSAAQPFSIALWVKIPKELQHGVLFHGNRGGIIYNFKGYQVSLESRRLDVRLAHTFPYNSIHLVAADTFPAERWQHVALTYDGSSDALGVRLYVNGRQQEMEVKRNGLYKDIIFIRENIETHLKVGARWRSKGLNDAWVDEIMVFDRMLTPLEVLWIADDNPIPGLLKEDVLPTDQQADQLFAYFLANHQPEYQQNLEALRLQREAYYESVEDIPELTITREMSPPRPAFVLERGQYDAHLEQVQPGTPKSILSFPEDLPQNRLGLAKWLFHEDNPLTGRVTVNRYWQLFFGKGIVDTPEDFGNQGDLPSHPALLDWLALYFRESGWNVKQLLKLIALSATYQQSSVADDALREADPDNRLLARGPKHRLTAEMLRDCALAASGLLVQRIGGPSVRPYQPEGLWRVNTGTYEQSQGDDLYRRSLYTIWKRTVPPPTMNIFDAPDRSYCMVRRQKTSTPQQALVLMNDPQFLEAARVLAQRAIEKKTGARARIRYLYQRLTGKQIPEKEQAILNEQFVKSLEKFEEYPEKVAGIIKVGEFPIPTKIDPSELAATAIVAGTIMNHDAFYTKR